jgi:nucleotide-binding universal stress UspA family protein
MTQHKQARHTESSSCSPAPKPYGPGVVLGVSSSPAGRAALAVAVREAAARQVPLRLVRIWADLAWFPSMTLDSFATMEATEKAGSAMLDEAVHLAHDLDPHVTLVPEAPAGELYDLLLDRALEADLLVLGSEHERPESDDFDSWFVQHADCPVVAVAGSGEVVRGSSYLRAGPAPPRPTRSPNICGGQP